MPRSNPYDSPETNDSSLPSVSGRLSAPVVFGVTFFLVHSFAMLAFASSNVAFAGPDVDAGAMVWILWLLADTPISWLVFPYAERCATNAGGVTILLITGGLQWAIWGVLVGLIVRHFSKSRRSKGIG